MGTRNIRVNELIKREISDFLHTHLRDQSTLITITDVDVSNDHHQARVYFSVIGDADAQVEAERFLKSNAGMIRGELGRRIVLKFTPRLDFHFDPSMERGDRLIRLLDELDIPEDND